MMNMVMIITLDILMVKNNYHYNKAGLLVLENVSLLEFVNSDMKSVEYQQAIANLYQIALEYRINKIDISINMMMMKTIIDF